MVTLVSLLDRVFLGLKEQTVAPAIIDSTNKKGAVSYFAHLARIKLKASSYGLLILKMPFLWHMAAILRVWGKCCEYVLVSDEGISRTHATQCDCTRAVALRV